MKPINSRKRATSSAKPVTKMDRIVEEQKKFAAAKVALAEAKKETILKAVTEEKKISTKKETTMTFGEKIRALREEQGISPDELAGAAGISVRTLENYELDHRKPRDAKTLEGLAVNLNTTVTELMSGVAEKPRKTQRNSGRGSSLGKKLIKLRKKAKLSQAEVASQIGVSTNSYLRYEKDHTKPRKSETYDKLAELFGVDVAELNPDIAVAASEVEDVAPVNLPVENTDVEIAEQEPASELAVSEENPTPKVVVIPADPEKRRQAMEEWNRKEERSRQEEEERIDEVSASAEAEARIDEVPAAAEAISLATRLAVLLSGSDLTRSEKDSVMVSLNGAYWKSR